MQQAHCRARPSDLLPHSSDWAEKKEEYTQIQATLMRQNTSQTLQIGELTNFVLFRRPEPPESLALPFKQELNLHSRQLVSPLFILFDCALQMRSLSLRVSVS
ncbi:hypothetical protein [Paracandidimonas lactea]|uniref:hypothetical protein n=1 Tax=Paracandidimonas lactea TaxID=2895524 RepID=UPI001F1BDFB9|nr:hypothetical protein [Paracandidimonas lactea]